MPVSTPHDALFVTMIERYSAVVSGYWCQCNRRFGLGLKARKTIARLIIGTKLFNNDSNVMVTHSPLTHCHIRQHGDNVRSHDTLSTLRLFVGLSKVTRCDIVQMHGARYVKQHLVGGDILQRGSDTDDEPQLIGPLKNAH